jgi:hypothetical protein
MLIPAKQLTGVLKTDVTVTSNVDQDLGGNQIINLGSPTLGTDAANKDYVDNSINGLKWKQPVKKLSTTNEALTGLPTIDGGPAMTAGQRVLLTGQTNPIENGAWLVAVGPWTRPLDFPPGGSAANAAFFVEAGTVNADTAWVCITDSPSDIIGPPGGNALSFVQFASPGVITASTGLTKVGNDIRLIQTAIAPVAVDASAAVVGVSQEAAHADHKHAVSVGSPTNVGAANAAGAASTLVRSDHVHRAENQQIQVATVNQTQRFNLNFVGAGVTITPTDDVGNNRTTLTFTVPAGSSPTKVIANPSAPTVANNDATGVTLATATVGATQVTVNGAEQTVQPTGGAPGSFDCFWTTDGGTTAVANSNVPSGATLRWRGTQAAFQLATTDVLIVGYNA